MPKQASYRVVVMDSRSPRGGVVLENLGYYLPQRKTKPLEIDMDLYNSWVKKGAIPTDSVRKLVKNLGKKVKSPAVQAKTEPVGTIAEEPSVAPPAGDSATTQTGANASEEAR